MIQLTKPFSKPLSLQPFADETTDRASLVTTAGRASGNFRYEFVANNNELRVDFVLPFHAEKAKGSAPSIC